MEFLWTPRYRNCWFLIPLFAVALAYEALYADEEWGEERLIPAVLAHSIDSAADIIPELMADADRFVAGAPQRDDMTLVILKVER